MNKLKHIDEGKPYLNKFDRKRANKNNRKNFKQELRGKY
tara:strand:- start:65 stop:181 length:117 start_codon:yes stop_codon:yes gene_type:complete